MATAGSLLHWRAAGRPSGRRAPGSPCPCHPGRLARSQRRRPPVSLLSRLGGSGTRGRSEGPARSAPSCLPHCTLRCITPAAPREPALRGWGARALDELGGGKIGWDSEQRLEAQRRQLEPPECDRLAPPLVALRAGRPRVRANR